MPQMPFATGMMSPDSIVLKKLLMTESMSNPFWFGTEPRELREGDGFRPARRKIAAALVEHCGRTD